MSHHPEKGCDHSSSSSTSYHRNKRFQKNDKHQNKRRENPALQRFHAASNYRCQDNDRLRGFVLLLPWSWNFLELLVPQAGLPVLWPKQRGYLDPIKGTLLVPVSAVWLPAHALGVYAKTTPIECLSKEFAKLHQQGARRWFRVYQSGLHQIDHHLMLKTRNCNNKTSVSQIARCVVHLCGSEDGRWIVQQIR